METLSDLSIGFIVGGILVFVLILVGFIIWKVIDTKRKKKLHGSEQSNSSAATASHGNSSNMYHNRERIQSSSAYSEVFYDSESQAVTLEYETNMEGARRKTNQSRGSADDSGYYESQSGHVISEQYSRLHEIQRHTENVYDELPIPGDKASTASISSSQTDQQAFEVTEDESSKKQNQNYLQATPTAVDPVIEGGDYYTLPIPHVQIVSLIRTCKEKEDAEHELDENETVQLELNYNVNEETVQLEQDYKTDSSDSDSSAEEDEPKTRQIVTEGID